MSATLPYGRHCIEDDDVAAVARVLRGDWLTTGPAIEAFEQALASYAGARHVVACNSGTAALYLAARALGVGPGDAVIVPAITFLATANANILAGAEVVFADVDRDTGLMFAEHAAAARARAPASWRIKAVAPVHLGGQVADPAALRRWADAAGLAVIEDACHALGTVYGNGEKPVGGCRDSDAACFSFHPVKAIAMGEGGAVTTNSDDIAGHVRRLRNHGMTRDAARFRNRALAFDGAGHPNPWYYEAHEPSHNLRLPDIAAALGTSQLAKIGRFLARRRALVERYRTLLEPHRALLAPAPRAPDCAPGWHLFAVLIDFARLGVARAAVMERLKRRGIATQVHYIPVHLQPFYRDRYGAADLPGAAAYYARTLTLPLFPAMRDADADRVVAELVAALGA